MRVDDVGDVWKVGSSVRLASDVEGLLGVLVELLCQLGDQKDAQSTVADLRDEQNEESVDILSRCRTVVDLSRVAVAESDADGLVQEEHVGDVVPRVLVAGDILAFVFDGAAAELEQQPGGG